uniref:Immunoglobulin domain-containing protein n=1 Tax=Poecilia reticulata TaxID=8081 RepID=A0A3P9PLP4_POERE
MFHKYEGYNMLNIFHCIFFSPGSESVETISKVSVKAGASVSIPCSYDIKYKNYVKYLCKGYSFNYCSFAVRTDSSQEIEKYSISEDKTQNNLNMTIKRLTADDTHFWCGVEINNGADDRQYFQLSVTTGTPSLSLAHQNVIGYIGDKITINCSYRNSGGVRWCKLGSTCVTKATVSGNIDGTAVTINMTISNVINVTMSGLKQESSGWYYCVKGDFQMPVHLTVTVKPTGKYYHYLLIRNSNNNVCFRPFSSLMILAIPLSVLIFIVIVALSILLVLKGTSKSDRTSAAIWFTMNEFRSLKRVKKE